MVITMTWTSEKPTVPGWYWWKDKDGKQAKFNVGPGDLGLWLWYRDGFGWVPIPSYGEWSGPLKPPKE